jgi:VanZ family protein
LLLLWRRALFWGAVGVVFVLALLPLPELPEVAFSLSDKAQHALVFLLLWLLGDWSYPTTRVLLSLGLFLYGGMIEVAQAFTPTRQMELADWIADAVGVAAAWLLAATLFQLRRQWAVRWGVRPAPLRGRSRN